MFLPFPTIGRVIFCSESEKVLKEYNFLKLLRILLEAPVNRWIGNRNASTLGRLPMPALSGAPVTLFWTNKNECFHVFKS